MQTSVAAMQPGFPGLIADVQLAKTTASRVNEGSAEMRFGIYVTEGTGANGCAIIDAQADVALGAGIVVHSHAYAKPDELGDSGLKQYVSVGVLVKGCIWVLTEGTAPTKTDHVRVRAIATGGEVAGAFRVAVDSTDTVDITAFARWTGRTGTNCAELDFDLTNRALAVAD